MVRRIALYLVLVAAAAAAYLATKPTAPNAVIMPAGAREEPVTRERPDTLGLSVDARFLFAVGDIHHLVTGAASASARALRTADGWMIAYGDSLVGAVSVLPNFDELNGALESWAARLGIARLAVRRAGEIRAIDASLTGLEALNAANACDARWAAGERTTAVLTRAARALTLLQLETTDLTSVSDRVDARAWAVVAAARAASPGALHREECLLAQRLGYGAHAWRAAESLPKEDPIRAFVRQEDAHLAALAAAPAAGLDARFLALLRSSVRRDLEEWEERLERMPDHGDDPGLPELATGFRLGRFETQMPASYRVLVKVMADLRLLGVFTGPETTFDEIPDAGETVRVFEETMASMAPEADGAFLDRAVLAAYYRAAFYSALFMTAEHYRVSLASVEDTQGLVEELAALESGVGAEFARWYRDVVDASSPRASCAQLLHDLAQVRTFGEPLLSQTLDAVRQIPGTTLHDRRGAGRLLIERLDSRPAHRVQAATVAWSDVLNLALAERWMASAAQNASPADTDIQGMEAALRGDVEHLVDLLGRANLTADQTAVLLHYLRSAPGVPPEVIRTAHQRAMVSYPESYEVVRSFAHWSSDSLGAYDEGRDAIKTWLDRRSGRKDLEWIIGQATLAHMYAGLGDHAKALATVTPFVRSIQGGVLGEAVRALAALGRTQEAERLARVAFMRYPSSGPALARLAEMCWRNGGYQRAATVLASTGTSIHPYSWRREIAPAFASWAKDRAPQALQAIDALPRSPAVGRWSLAEACADSGAVPLALAIIERTHSDQDGDRYALALRGYQFARRLRGDTQAEHWLARRTARWGEDARGVLCLHALHAGESRVVWILPPPAEEPYKTGHWVMRAAATLQGRTAQQDSTLRAYFAGPGSHRYHVLGRYLLGMASETEALACGVGPKSRCEAYYFTGLKAQSEGRYADAAARYERAISSGWPTASAHLWAETQLQAWSLQWLSMSRREELEGRRAPETPALTALAH